MRDRRSVACAAAAASRAFDAMAADRASRGPGTFRYRRTSTRARGEILRVENVVVRAEGPDEAAVERAIDGLTFLSPIPHSPDRWLSGLVEEHLSGFLGGLGVYLVVVTVAMFKDGAWRADYAYRYSYNLNELKQPLVGAVVVGGWTYQPVAFFLPLLG